MAPSPRWKWSAAVLRWRRLLGEARAGEGASAASASPSASGMRTSASGWPVTAASAGEGTSGVGGGVAGASGISSATGGGGFSCAKSSLSSSASAVSRMMMRWRMASAMKRFRSAGYADVAAEFHVPLSARTPPAADA